MRSKSITMSLLALFAVVCAALPAAAECVVDEDSALDAARAAALTRFCPGFAAIDDESVLSLFEEMGAVEPSEDLRLTCIAIVVDRVAMESARLRKSAERDAACATAANDPRLSQILDALGLVKAPR